MLKGGGAGGQMRAAWRTFAVREAAKFRVECTEHCARRRIMLAGGNCRCRKTRHASQNSSPKPGVRISLLRNWGGILP
jgi:hypothetical protein